MQRVKGSKITYDISQEPIVISQPLMNLFLQQEDSCDIGFLYLFYYSTAKWQKTNSIKCTTSYVAKGLKWTEKRVRKAKKVLIDLGLVEDKVVHKENGDVAGWYIVIHFIWGQDKVSNLAPCTISTVCEKAESAKEHSVRKSRANALSTNNINALSNNNINALSNNNISPNSKNNNSILDEKQKQKARQLKRYERLSETLYDHVQESRKMKISKTRIKSWAEDMVKLENLNGIDYYRQKEALDWFINHYQEEFMPVIQSGTAFREKFLKIEDARNRIAQARKKKSGNTIGHLSPEPIDYGPVARWDEETQTIIPSGKFAQKTK